MQNFPTFPLHNPSRLGYALFALVMEPTQTKERAMRQLINNDLLILTDDQRVVCRDCKAWEHYTANTKTIRHSRRCDTPHAQVQFVAEATDTKAFAKPGQFSKESPGSGLTSDELYDAYKRGLISQSDAMNTDF
jgi:hypothetical protein